MNFAFLEMLFCPSLVPKGGCFSVLHATSSTTTSSVAAAASDCAINKLHSISSRP